MRAVEAGSLWTWRTVEVSWQWLLAPLVSHWRGLSLVRFLSVFIAVVIGHEVFVHEKSLGWVDFWMMLAAIAAAFGKPIFALLLSRVGQRTVAHDIKQDIQATFDIRREPSPQDDERGL